MKMNKRADISIVILVIGIIAVCFLAILSFVKSNENIDDNFLGIGLIETMNSIQEEQDFYDETPFVGDYGNFFEGENVKINIDEENFFGESFIEEIEFKFGIPPYEFKEKTIVRITYNK